MSYRLVFLLLSPLIVAHLAWKSVQSRSLRYFKQRLGFGIKPTSMNTIWFHCASVGEVNTVLPLIYALHERDSELRFTLTTNTITGASIVIRQNKLYIQHIYLPLDMISTTRRFINKVKPVALYIVETELWPNLIHVCSRAGIKSRIINARLTARTTESGTWMLSIYKKTLAKIDFIYARTETDNERFIALGANADKTNVTGNLKYAFSNSINRPQDLTKRPYVIAASTHDNEEYQIAEAWLNLGRDELLVIAPRHPERKKQIIEKLFTLTPHIVCRTDNNEIIDSTKIFILDTVGELLSWYINAHVVIVGGSFADFGGHNVIEPAQCGKAIIYGPHMDNFAYESQLLLDHQAAIQLDNMRELEAELTRLLDHVISRQQLEKAALAAVAPFKSVLNRYSDIVLENFKPTH